MGSMNISTPSAIDPKPAAAKGHRLLDFNRALIDQASALAAACIGADSPRYVGPMGAHLRHVIEHYEALLFPARAGMVDYDARARDAELEATPSLALARLQALNQALASCPAGELDQVLSVRGQIGVLGEFGFQARSSLGRELAFLASHTVHHFALLAGTCAQQGIATPEGFGKAPATRAHERGTAPLASA
jgi:hypothetical protein